MEGDGKILHTHSLIRCITYQSLQKSSASSPIHPPTGHPKTPHRSNPKCWSASFSPSQIPYQPYPNPNPNQRTQNSRNQGLPPTTTSASHFLAFKTLCFLVGLFPCSSLSKSSSFRFSLSFSISNRLVFSSPPPS